jgi:hypothetical protein
MDLTPIRDYVPVPVFAAALDRVARGVALVTAATDVGRSSGTGWLITDDLVVTTGRLAGFAADLECRVGDQVVAAEVVYTAAVLSGPVQFPDWRDVALLKLRRPAPATALSLAVQAHHADEPVYLVHLPDGGNAAQVSIGRLGASEAPLLVHDLAAGPGSAGAPLCSMRGEVVGMTVGVTRAAAGRVVNAGVTVGGLLHVLQNASCWDEIVEHHDLVDWAAVRARLRVASTERPPVGGLLWCAVRWSIDPADLAAADLDAVRSVVIDPAAERWVMRGADRQRILAGAGSIELLRAARGAVVIDDPRQRVVDRILAGPPFAVDDLPEDVLPLWLQAVRWFAGAVPGLPSAATISRQLERRRLRSRLGALTRPRFWGRREELRTLNAWYAEDDPPPMTVTGIGGIGKSCLVAQFAGDFPPDSVILWLDFDRADVAPDDARSVLTVLAEQLSVQVGADPDLVEAAAFGAELHRTTAGSAAPLLVFDGFEIAQHAERHGEVWRLLDAVLAEAPRLRVLVVGRAPIVALRLRDRHARHLVLDGLDDAVAAEWLELLGVVDAEARAKILSTAHGVPLLLQLAERYVAAGGSVNDVPNLQVEGFLYRRILDRVVDDELQALARDALVLRRVTPDIIADVLHDSRPAGVEPMAVFRRLAQELALVTPDRPDAPDLLLGNDVDALRLRPEIRIATLALLARDDAARVREIDGRAAAWYRRQPPTPTATAELVYHLLRLDDVPGAAQAWRDEVAALLTNAPDDLPPAAQAWLAARLTSPVLLDAWEGDAEARIRDAYSRGLDRLVPDILAEHDGRSPQSPLLLHDAWTLHFDDVDAAREMLSAAPPVGGVVGRNRTVLAAWLAERAERRRAAQALLATVESDASWQDTANPELMTLAVWAARVRLTVDLSSEARLRQRLRDGPDFNVELVPLEPGAVLLPDLVAAIQRNAPTFRQHRPLTIPAGADQVPQFAAAVNGRARQAFLSVGPSAPDEEDTKIRLILLYRQRLALAGAGTALGRACALALSGASDDLSLAIARTLFAFRGNQFDYPAAAGNVRLDAIVEQVAKRNGSLGPTDLFMHGPDPLAVLLSVLAGIPVTRMWHR